MARAAATRACWLRCLGLFEQAGLFLLAQGIGNLGVGWIQGLDGQGDQFHAKAFLYHGRVFIQVVQDVGRGKRVDPGALGIFFYQPLQQDLHLIGGAHDRIAIPAADADERLDVFERRRNRTDQLDTHAQVTGGGGLDGQLDRAGGALERQAEMARIDQAFPKADAAIGLIQHQEIRLADAVFKKSQQQDNHYDNPNDNTQDDVHAPYLLGNALARIRSENLRGVRILIVCGFAALNQNAVLSSFSDRP